MLWEVPSPSAPGSNYNYDSNGYLLSMDGPLAGSHDKTNYTYDGCGRVYTGSDCYRLKMSIVASTSSWRNEVNRASILTMPLTPGGSDGVELVIVFSRK